jgi:16S rRNA (guanine(966)-N(2))-methyltransferase RsmD
MRPTLAKVRESVFNILRGWVEGAVFLDLYAGTGKVGMDAMGEGASEVYFVEENARLAGRITELISGCRRHGPSRCACRAKVLNLKTEAFLKKAQKDGFEADIAFLDPPYGSDELERALPMVSGVLKPGGLVLAEHSSRRPLPQSVGGLHKRKDYKYGDTMLTLYEKGISPAEY